MVIIVLLLLITIIIDFRIYSKINAIIKKRDQSCNYYKNDFI